MMREYVKIETVFNRDVNGTKKMIEGSFRNETVEYLKDSKWDFTEKIDGTNIRVFWDGHKVSFGGRTEKSEIPVELLEYLYNTFATNEVEELFEQKFGDKEVILFGEGYGGKIQGNKGYRPDCSFILFDVLIGNVWLKRNDVADIARCFGISIVPILFSGTIDEGVRFVKSKPKSTIGNADMEGVVARPSVEIRDRLGNRVITKIKVCDFI